MSTGRRLAKRSIIGTKVCAPGPEGLLYSGVIVDVKTPPSYMSGKALAPLSPPPPPPPTFLAPGEPQLNADTRYLVRFDFKTQQLPMQHAAPSTVSASSSSSSSTSTSPSDASVIVEARRVASVHISPAQALRRNAMIKEFRESDLIGPGFRSIMGIQLQPGQRVFLTYNGREQSGDVVEHDASKDEVVVKITTVGNEEPIELKKRLEEVRLLESRRSARLADQDRDTDFARLADMSGDRRRTTTHSIEVLPHLTGHSNSRKRPSSDHQDYGSNPGNEDQMVECNAAMILMKLHNPNGVSDHCLGSSPGSSSSASWSSGSASPPLSDDGHGHGHHSPNILSPHDAANARIRTTSVSTSDEGIVIDFKDDRKKKVSAMRSLIPHYGSTFASPTARTSRKFRCTYPNCSFKEHDESKMKRHISINHLSKEEPDSGDYDSCSEHEEDFYYTDDDGDDELVKKPSLASEPTLSHRDMARPPHEDPEYQKLIVGNFKQGRALHNYNHQTHQQQLTTAHHSGGGRGMHHISSIPSNQQQQLQNNNTSCTPTSHLAHHNYTSGWPTSSPGANTTAMPSPVSTLNKHARTSSSRPSHSVAPYPSPTFVQQQQQQQHHRHSSSSSNNSNPVSPVIHCNSSANNMLQQLSQQNVTVTAHAHHSQVQLSSVTITPNYHPTQQQQPLPPHQSQQQPQHQEQQPPHPHQPHVRGQQQSTASNNLVATNNNNNNSMPLQHVAVQQSVGVAKHTPNSPNRRTRGENKKCRKVYGMEKRDQWCTQCRWKKACSRFGD
ncbi:histone acetyltransferase KAT6A isoform X1 [Drosophila guanche]|uniref:histone acetyltransferase KAT6A isoform X1 n=1 Tax=Drosophila guanche TaxID=7266 RepID=UPI0014720FAE|nr:histone acetyltransferase KAT6A isoform X1 [Drosophila guanche]